MLYFECVILNKYLGDALYAVLFYLIISIIVSNIHSVARGGLAFTIMIMLELFQLTQIPHALSQNKYIVARFIAIMLGAVFSWLDIFAYLVGIVVIIIFEETTLKKR